MILFLIIKKHWFNEILKGNKTIEYREYKEYYHNKFSKNYSKIILQVGYYKNSLRLEAEIIKIDISENNVFNDLFNEQKKVYRIHLKNPKQIR